MKSNPSLFVNLMYRLKSYRNTAVLMFLLEVEADQKDYVASVPVLAHRYMGNQLSRREVQKAVDDLEELGLISTRVHANTKTYFKVNADQVRALLAQPLPEHLPGMDDLQYPFLQSWKDGRAQPDTSPNSDA